MPPKKLIFRLRTPTGQFRIELNPSQSAQDLKEKIATAAEYQGEFEVSTDPQGQNKLQLEAEISIQSLGLRNGEILYTTHMEKKVTKDSSLDFKFIKQHPVDDYLLKQDGTITRRRDPQYCKHGENGMCEYCMALQPYDAKYLEENGIKHMSFHAYLRQIIEKNKLPVPSDPRFIPPLDEPNYEVVKPCPSRSHEPFPDGLCSKCQPSAITLQTQNFRMVDHVEIESHAVIDNFLQYWRNSGNQRVGFMFGRYEPYDKVPLGVKAVVSAIFEPKQESGRDYIQLLDNGNHSEADEIASQLGLEIVGIVYTDLFDDGTGKGTVICKRHGKSYFLSSAEILFSAELQGKYPMKTMYSSTSEFGSRFITCVISGNEDGGIDIQGYQVSNSAQSMTKASIIEASVKPELMRVCSSSNRKYVPDVFYKYKNEYNLMVQEAAKPTFPVEYLLITSSHGFPLEENPLFNSNANYVENRETISSKRSIRELAQTANNSLQFFSDFHLLLFLKESGILDNNTMELLLKAVKNRSNDDFAALIHCEGWKNFQTILQEYSNSQSGGNRSSTDPNNLAPWACRHCTFVNIGSDSCEMCGLPQE